jgi:hypothetical protein
MKMEDAIFFIAKNPYLSPLLENVWTKHYSQPPNSTLGGLHMTQTIHDLLRQIPLKTHQNGHATGGNNGLGNLWVKCHLGVFS